jgi:hypothetical protein
MKNTSTKRVLIAGPCVTPSEALYNLLGRCHGNITATATTVIAFRITSMRRNGITMISHLPLSLTEFTMLEFVTPSPCCFCEVSLERECAIGMA